MNSKLEDTENSIFETLVNDLQISQVDQQSALPSIHKFTIPEEQNEGDLYLTEAPLNTKTELGAQVQVICEEIYIEDEEVDATFRKSSMRATKRQRVARFFSPQAIRN